jgi:DNA ligase-1
MSTSELIAALDASDSENALRPLTSALWNSLSDSRILNDILLGRHTHWCTESKLATAIANVNNLDRHAVVYELHQAGRPQSTVHRPQSTVHRPPFSFMMPHQSTHIPDSWLDTSIWASEPKYDGMRAQAVITDGEVVLWSMHGDIIDVGDAVVAPLRSAERDLIVDGELVDNRTRYVPFDLLDVDGIDLRHKPYAERRTLLHALVPQTTDAPSEGTVYKRLDSRYTAGTEHTDWYAVRFPRTVITCTLMYAIGDQFTFGVLHKGEVVNVVQLSRGIPQRDQERLLAYVRDHQTGRDGPARLVAPGLLVRISYTTLHPAPRRKLGVKLNSPRWEGLGGEALSEL